MNDDIKKILVNSGMKEKKVRFLLKLARKKNISVSRAFFLYAWKYYAWGGALFFSMLFPASMGGFELFIMCILCCLILVLISVFFNPFFINLVWSIKLQLKLMGKR
ncbi:hypothetical protein M3B74_01435 [Citrobacter freundii]|jgi:uncharacterized membrane protein|uniref:Uncharacterized protein n=2 Tax=Citrobacter freundii TaxID=546 RepID=A0A9P3Z6A8_CITFR|nr:MULTISPECIES: hypothetical protein [Citrobacter]MDR4048761.1 hypothetical protein [Citrobacter sp.]ANZ85821.1 hypothetical protein CfB38_0892 [Citrobacter freundii]EIX7374068.1 hypothetical protein [Citrobacter freundii]EJC8214832.1 hypothetical protein [Citrobacter freundii]EJM7587663.1 hypothetical protein [Citrobacter freundii]